MELHDFLCYGKSEARSARGSRTGGIQPEKLLEDMLQLLLGDCLPPIPYTDLHPVLNLLYHGKINFRPLIAVADRIPDQIVKHSLQLVGIAEYLHIRDDTRADGKLLFRKHRPELVYDLFQHPA